MPSCMKSFILPVAYTLAREAFTPSDGSIENLKQILQAIGQSLGGVSIPELFAHWIEYSTQFPEQASRLSTLGLLAVLKLTCADMELASVKIKKGGRYSESKATVLLQTKLVSEFAQFLVAQVRPAETSDKDEPGSDYGDEYGG